MDAVLDDWRAADVAPRMRAALELLAALTEAPASIDRDAIAGWREAGLDPASMHQIASIAFHFNLLNRLMDAYDFPAPTGKALQRQSRLLNMAGHGKKNGRFSERARGEDGRLRPVLLDRLWRGMIEAPGATDATWRRDVGDAVHALRLGEEATLPEPWSPYLTKVALHAYRVVDEDFDALRAAGMREDAIYEATAVAATAAAMAGLCVMLEAMV